MKLIEQYAKQEIGFRPDTKEINNEPMIKLSRYKNDYGEWDEWYLDLEDNDWITASSLISEEDIKLISECIKQAKKAFGGK